MRIEDVVPLQEVIKSAPLYKVEEHYDGLGEYIVEAGMLLAHHDQYAKDPRPERLSGASIAAGIAIGWRLHERVQ